jgi:hypothetical protein
VSLLLILFQSMMRNCLRRLRVVHPNIQTIGIPLQWEDIILFGAREEKTGASSLKCHSLAEDVKLNAYRRYPTAYPFYFYLCLFILFLFLFLFSFVTLVFCFSGTSMLEFKFGGNALSQTYSRQFSKSQVSSFHVFTHWRQCAI